MFLVFDVFGDFSYNNKTTGAHGMDRPREIVARGFDLFNRRVRREVEDIIVRFTPEYAADQLGLGARQGSLRAFLLGSIERDRESGASWQQQDDRESPQHNDDDPCVALGRRLKLGASGHKDTSNHQS